MTGHEYINSGVNSLEQKTALNLAAVTGKIDVRDWMTK